MRRRTSEGFPVLQSGTKIGKLFRILVHSFGKGIDAWELSQAVGTTCLHSHADDLRGLLPREVVLFVDLREGGRRFYGLTTVHARGERSDLFFEDDFARLKKAAQKAVESMTTREGA